jgi:hypothetical protein
MKPASSTRMKCIRISQKASARTSFPKT